MACRCCFAIYTGGCKQYVFLWCRNKLVKIWADSFWLVFIFWSVLEILVCFQKCKNQNDNNEALRQSKTNTPTNIRPPIENKTFYLQPQTIKKELRKQTQTKTKKQTNARRQFNCANAINNIATKPKSNNVKCNLNQAMISSPCRCANLWIRSTTTTSPYPLNNMKTMWWQRTSHNILLQINMHAEMYTYCRNDILAAEPAIAFRRRMHLLKKYYCAASNFRSLSRVLKNAKPKCCKYQVAKTYWIFTIGIRTIMWT